MKAGSHQEALARDEFLTIEAVAENLKISRATVYALLGRGEIASVKIGRSRRIPRAALTRFKANLVTSAAS